MENLFYPYEFSIRVGKFRVEYSYFLACVAALGSGGSRPNPPLPRAATQATYF